MQRVKLRCNTSCRFLCSWAVAWRSHRLAGLALLLVLPTHVDAQAFDDSNLGTWLTDPVTATTNYGPITDWNTAAVTRMASLLLPTFNGDISKWNVASVSNMYMVCVPCLRQDGIFI